MPQISIRLKKRIDDSHTITIQNGIFADIHLSLDKSTAYAIITDNKVKKLYGEKLLQSLKKHKIHAELISIPEGEKRKTLTTIEKITETMLGKGFDRSSTIIALGGGVIGDIAGFTASIFMRGIPFIQIPTTLLAMIDSSIGGKTGVNISGGKNMIGSFHQPQSVFIDPEMLKTLPLKEMKNGFVELIKHAIIKNAKLFEFIETHYQKIFTSDLQIVNKIIAQSCKIKARIIEKDEKEISLRMLLNYGHTIGHAIEKESAYRLPHGICVAKGIVAINRMAVQKKLMDPKDADRIENLFQKLRINTEIPKNISIEDIKKTIEKDKKFRKNKKNVVIVRKIGKAEIRTISIHVIMNLIGNTGH